MIVPIFDGDRCLYLSFKVWLSHLPVSLPDSNLISSQMVSDDKLGNKTFYGLRKKFNNFFWSQINRNIFLNTAYC